MSYLNKSLNIVFIPLFVFSSLSKTLLSLRAKPHDTYCTSPQRPHSKDGAGEYFDPQFYKAGTKELIILCPLHKITTKKLLGLELQACFFFQRVPYVLRFYVCGIG